MKHYLEVSQEVAAALEAGWPVVALESTVIAHGLPYPSNVETALALEAIIRDADVTPATIAVRGGKVRIGISENEIESLAGEQGALKLGTRDLPGALDSGESGATTVSATVFIADRVGIAVFVTGGIGGVHRGAARTFDISSDLWELAKSGVIVVCAGAKGVLDLSATLEWLETHQIPVLGYRTDEFPAFYSRCSGLKIERVEGPEQVAHHFLLRRRLGMTGGMVVAVPVPAEAELALDDEISQAVEEAEKTGLRGKEVTPRLLARLAELTGGKSIAANIALLKNNAAVGAEIAKALATRLKRAEEESGKFV